VIDRTTLQKRLDRATAHLETPVAAVDLAAFDDNAAQLVARAGGKPLRVASKSVRCRNLLERVLARPGWHGVMAYTLGEAIWLVREGVTDDVLVAYPTVDRIALRELTTQPDLAAAISTWSTRSLPRAPGPSRSGSAWTSTRPGGPPGHFTSAYAGRPCTPPVRRAPWPGASSPGRASSSSG
jgi:hypothetical protein